jgi:hypothetical protein
MQKHWQPKNTYNSNITVYRHKVLVAKIFKRVRVVSRLEIDAVGALRPSRRATNTVAIPVISK